MMVDLMKSYTLKESHPLRINASRPLVLARRYHYRKYKTQDTRVSSLGNLPQLNAIDMVAVRFFFLSHFAGFEL